MILLNEQVQDHEIRIVDLEKADIKFSGKLDVLCESMQNLSKQFDRFFEVMLKICLGIGGIVITSVIGFVIWCMEGGV